MQVESGAEVAKKRKKSVYVYDPALYENFHKARQQTILIPYGFVNAGLTKDKIKEASSKLGVSVNSWWAAAALLAEKNPKAMKEIFRSYHSDYAAVPQSSFDPKKLNGQNK